MKILITGANSFVGRGFVDHLLRAGHEVTATYRTHDARIASLTGHSTRLKLVTVDLAEPRDFAALPQQIDAVVHVAGISTTPKGDVDDLLRCNVFGTRNVLRYALAAAAQKLIYTSTLSVHGRIDTPVVDHRTAIVEPDVYGASKYLGERLLAAESARLPSLALRLPGVLGQGSHRAWLPTLTERAKAGQDIVIYNADGDFNNATHVDDLGEFVVSLLDRDWSGFHAMPLGAAGAMKVRDVVSILLNAVGSSSRVAATRSASPCFTISSVYASERFGYRPTPIDALLNRYAAEIKV
jgi:nucleoside-diphosphate-sugar epimerase